MSSQPINHLYRSLLREVRLSARKPRAKRNLTVETHLRELVETSTSQERLGRTLMEARDFLRATRIHAELLKRYNPIADMSEEEKIHATARRVGLDTPLEYKPK